MNNDTSDEADSTGDELDLSDEAFWDWDEQFNRLHMDTSFSQHALDGWQEARRRGLSKYDEVMKCWNESIDDKNRELDTLREAVRRCEARMEERERKAFEAGFDAGMDDLDMDEVWRAFKEALK